MFRTEADIAFRQLDVSRLLASTGLRKAPAHLAARRISIPSEIPWPACSTRATARSPSAPVRATVRLPWICPVSSSGPPCSPRWGCRTGRTCNALSAIWGLQRGTLRIQTFLLDTSEGILNAAETINLTDETLALQVKTDAKHFKIGSLPAPIDIGGHTPKKPTIKPEVAALGLRAGVAVGLGVIAPPLALLPTIQFGVGEHNECAKHFNPVADNGTGNHPVQ